MSPTKISVCRFYKSLGVLSFQTPGNEVNYLRMPQVGEASPVKEERDDAGAPRF
jgi:hypothetical protein